MAGVQANILRIGFVGELGYEIHYPSEYGEYLWDAFMEEGTPFGIVPFGVETQRILRLGKKAHPGRAGHGRPLQPAWKPTSAGWSTLTNPILSEKDPS